VTAAPASLADLDWIIDRLAERRAPLVALAPVFWRPAPDATDRHRQFIGHLLSDGGGNAYRTADSVLVAAPRGDGWVVDDLHVTDERWAADGVELWTAFAADCNGDDVRLVCPTYERDRARFASSVGLTVAETWWLLELESGGGEAGVHVPLPGADALTVGAPPVYALPGPMLLLPTPPDAATAVPAAVHRAPKLGCAGVVVNQPAGDRALAEVLRSAGLRPHCDFFTGVVVDPV
jgi:hypothetical protein